MLYTLISLLLILLILFSFTWVRFQTSSLIKGYTYLSIVHTNLLKGIASVLIIISHIANMRGVSILIPLGGIGVALFLICSGYGLNESFKRKGLNDFFKNRLLKILIPYWLIVCFHWISNYKEFNVQDFVKSFVLVYRMPLSWFVYYILIWYAIFYLGKRLLNEKQSLIAFISIGLIFLFLFKDTTVGEQSFSFVIGIVLSQFSSIKEYLVEKIKEMTILLFIIGLFFASVFLLLKIQGLDTINNYYIMNIIQLLMKIPLAGFIMQFTFNFKNYLYIGLMTIGTYSFEIYLSHAQILETLRSGNYVDLIMFFVIVIFIVFVINKLSNIFSNKLLKKHSIVSNP